MKPLAAESLDQGRYYNLMAGEDIVMAKYILESGEYLHFLSVSKFPKKRSAVIEYRVPLRYAKVNWRGIISGGIEKITIAMWSPTTPLSPSDLSTQVLETAKRISLPKMRALQSLG